MQNNIYSIFTILIVIDMYCLHKYIVCIQYGREISEWYIFICIFIFSLSRQRNPVWQGTQARNLRNLSYGYANSIWCSSDGYVFADAPAAWDPLKMLQLSSWCPLATEWGHCTWNYETAQQCVQRGKLFRRNNVSAESHLEVALDGQ